MKAPTRTSVSQETAVAPSSWWLMVMWTSPAFFASTDTVKSRVSTSAAPARTAAHRETAADRTTPHHRSPPWRERARRPRAIADILRVGRKGGEPRQRAAAARRQEPGLYRRPGNPPRGI